MAVEQYANDDRPAQKVATIASQSMVKDPELIADPAKLIKFLFTANHMSPFEHVSLTVRFTNVSRSFLSQIRTHRLASFISSSQHYQNYSNYDLIYTGREDHKTRKVMEAAIEDYKRQLNMGVPKEIARQVLPEAMAVNIIMTANARELAHIFNVRLCRRNTIEMQSNMVLLYMLANNWFPELFSLVGPDCVQSQCKQGRMSCGQPFHNTL